MFSDAELRICVVLIGVGSSYLFSYSSYCP